MLLQILNAVKKAVNWVAVRVRRWLDPPRVDSPGPKPKPKYDLLGPWTFIDNRLGDDLWIRRDEVGKIIVTIQRCRDGWHWWSPSRILFHGEPAPTFLEAKKRADWEAFLLGYRFQERMPKPQEEPKNVPEQPLEGVTTLSEETPVELVPRAVRVRALAHQLWIDRGSPMDGDPNIDWQTAERMVPA